jgi:hypothetical protein
MGRAASPVEIRRCADDRAPDLAEPPRDQAGVPQSGNPQGQIEPTADEVDHFIAEMEIDRHLRMRNQELGQDRGHMNESERHRSGEAHYAARHFGLGNGLGLGGFALVQHAQRMREKAPADFAQHESA